MPVKLRTRRDFLRSAALSAAGVSAVWAQEPVPLAPAARRKKIIVIGAGLAGLSAAYELSQAGHEVVISEAQGTGRAAGCGRCGMRFQTGSTQKRGAESFGDNHTYVQHWVKQFALPMMPTFATGSLRSLLLR